MKQNKYLWLPFLNKEKLMILLIIFMMIVFTSSMVFHQSVYSLKEYATQYPHAGLHFFYYLYCIGINPFLFILMMLLMPNLISYDFLNMHQTHCSYFIETRISKKKYYHDIFIKNIFFSFLTVLILQILLLLVIHFFYLPIHFHTMTYPQDYYVTAQVLSSNEIISMTLFILLTSLGYALISSLLFSLQVLISNKYIYRCFGVIFGIFLILLPVLIQGILPINDLAFLIQVNNITAIGMENVRTNPLGMSNHLLYFLCFIIYSFFSFYAFQTMKKWRQSYE